MRLTSTRSVTRRPQAPPFDAQRALRLLGARAKRMALGNRAPSRFFLFVSEEQAKRLEPYRSALIVKMTQLLFEHLRRSGLSATGVTLTLRADPLLSGDQMHAQAFARRRMGQRRFLVRSLDGNVSRHTPLHEGRISIGRGPDNDIVLTDKMVSSRHAEFIVTTDQVQVRDVGSTNGTFVNGEKISQGVAILVQPDEEVRCGRTVLIIEG